ncbi:MAG: DUF2490 domain-containing protein [Cyclobacteriaceae bacterium]
MKLENIMLIVALLFPGFTVLAQQQEKVINDQEQFWWSVNTTARFSDKLGMVGDFHLRRNDFLNETNFYFVRVGAVYWASDQLTLVAGYGHLWLSKDTESSNLIYQGENRIYQQVQWKSRSGRFSFLNRVRNEQRWHDVLDNEGEYVRTRFSNRVRFLASVSFRVFNNPRLPQLVVADEVHVHFGKEMIYNTFDQNRIFTGIKVPVTRDLKFDFGYMMVYQQHFDGYTYDMNHTLRWFFYYTPDFRKK